MKQIYIFLVCLFASIGMNAQDKVMTVDNQTPGWLSSKMTYAQQVAVEDLTVIGYINPTDMEFINGLIGKRNLKVLNLYNVVTINANNDDYYLWPKFLGYNTSKTIQKVILPKIIKGGYYTPITGRGTGYAIDADDIDTLGVACSRNTDLGLASIKHILLLEGTDTIPSYCFEYGPVVCNFPNSLKVIEDAAFATCKFSEPLRLPKGVTKIGVSREKKSWDACYYGIGGSYSISQDRFDFPDSLIVYYSKYAKEDHAYNTFSSDTITVGEKCDSLFAKLNTKVACFYAKNPPKHFDGDYNIETLYVPNGCVDIYKEAYKSDNIKVITEIKKVAEVTILNSAPIMLKQNEHTNLLFEVQPSDAFDKRLKWSSDNEEVATVDDNGEVYAHKSGTATITVTTYDGSVSNSCEIIVAKPVAGVSIEPAEVELTELGKTAQLTAKIQPEDATNKNVTWKSSNESVCIISNNGELLTTGYGKTVVLATTEDGNYVGTCIVTVSEETGIDNTMLSSEVKEVSRFSSQGQRLTAPTKGVNIVKYCDGSVRKEIVK